MSPDAMIIALLVILSIVAYGLIAGAVFQITYYHRDWPWDVFIGALWPISLVVGVLALVFWLPAAFAARTVRALYKK